MPIDDFYLNQTDITAAKIKLYQGYIGTYLIKVLMKFGKCSVADLFCGPGKNGAEKGSPLVLLEEAEKMLTSETLKRLYPYPEVSILFNDIEPDHIANLAVELSHMTLPREIRIETPTSKHFRDVINSNSMLLRSPRPKFFFLDPFNYSDVTMEDIKRLIDSPFTEVLLFLPAFFAYRFAGVETEEKTKRFLESFTTRGIADYADFDDFIGSIREKLLASLGIEFVRPIILDAGQKKNTLFFLSKSIHGMLVMNEVIWEDAYDGKRVLVKGQEEEPGLFTKQALEVATPALVAFERNLLEEMKNRKSMTNVDVIRFAIKEGFLPRHAEDIIKKHHEHFSLVITDGKQKRPYVSTPNINTARSIIKYIE